MAYERRGTQTSSLNGSYSTLAARFLALATLDLSAAVPPVTEAPPTIAYSSSSSPLAVENLVQGGPFTLTGSQAFTYTTAEGGGTAGYVAPTVVGNEIAPYLLAFDTDASTIDVRYVGSASPTYRMLVDGEAVTPFAQVAGGGGSGAKWRINVVFPNNRMRRVVIESTTLFVRSVYTAATDTILPAPKPALSLALLGDSYIAQQNVDGIPLVACRALGVAPIINGSGGTGYLNSQGGANGKQVYGDRLAGLLAANPSALVVFGGINDTAGAPLQAACSAVIVAARAAQPRMPVVIVGSQNPPSQAGAGVGKAANLQAAAAASGAFFVDMTTGNLYDTAGTLLAAGSAWITGTGHVGGTTGDGNADIYIGSDTTHPYTTTDTTVRDGWVYHGLRLAAALQTVLTVGV